MLRSIRVTKASWRLYVDLVVKPGKFDVYQHRQSIETQKGERAVVTPAFPKNEKLGYPALT
jgi:hypothetical protein